MTPAQFLFGLLTVSSVVVAVWFAFEEYLLVKDKHPITWYTRRLVNKYWFTARVIEMLAVFVFAVSVTHFYLDSALQPCGVG